MMSHVTFFQEGLEVLNLKCRVFFFQPCFFGDMKGGQFIAKNLVGSLFFGASIADLAS